MNRLKSCTLEFLESRALFSASLASQLDPTFGVSGTAETILQHQSAKLGAIAIQGESTIIAAIVPGDSTHFSVEVFRLRADGALDSTFGQNGFARIDQQLASPIPYDDIRSMAIAQNGNIIIGATRSDPGIGQGVLASNSALVVYELTANGGTPSDFRGGSGPIVIEPAIDTDSSPDTYTFDTVGAVVANPDGTFYVTGSSSRIGESTFLAKFLPDGTLTQFGGVSLGNFSKGTAMAVQDNGAVLVAGYETIKNKTQLVLMRFNPGFNRAHAVPTLDTTFGNRGVATLSIGGIDDEATSIATLSNGKIAVGGLTTKGSAANGTLSSQFVVALFNPNGKLDATFGNRGVVLGSPLRSAEAAITSVNIVETRASDFRIIASGKIATSLANAGAGVTSAFAAAYTPKGKLDSLFGKAGVEILTAPPTGTTGDSDLTAVAPLSHDTAATDARLANFIGSNQGAAAQTSIGDLRYASVYHLNSDTHLFATAQIRPAADLTISESVKGGQAIHTGQKIDLIVTVKNSGTAAFNNKVLINIGVDIGLTTLAMKTPTLNLAPGGSESFEFHFKVQSNLTIADPASLLATVQPLGSDEEVDGSNDSFTLPIIGKAS